MARLSVVIGILCMLSAFSLAFGQSGNQTSAYDCKGDEFQCPNDACIPSYWQCDNYNDCGDFSDEMGCPGGSGYGTMTTASYESYDCSEDGAFQCPNGNMCIPSYWQCDNYNDCGDFSDEMGCTGGSGYGYGSMTTASAD